jgi:hypothetical protein
MHHRSGLLGVLDIDHEKTVTFTKINDLILDSTIVKVIVGAGGGVRRWKRCHPIAFYSLSFVDIRLGSSLMSLPSLPVLAPLPSIPGKHFLVHFPERPLSSWRKGRTWVCNCSETVDPDPDHSIISLCSPHTNACQGGEGSSPIIVCIRKARPLEWRLCYFHLIPSSDTTQQP